MDDGGKGIVNKSRWDDSKRKKSVFNNCFRSDMGKVWRPTRGRKMQEVAKDMLVFIKIQMSKSENIYED